jgi:hypothetical protein
MVEWLNEADLVGYETQRQRILAGNWTIKSAQWYQRKDGQSLGLSLRTDAVGAAHGQSLLSVEDLVSATCAFIVDAPLIVDDLILALRQAWRERDELRGALAGQESKVG